MSHHDFLEHDAQLEGTQTAGQQHWQTLQGQYQLRYSSVWGVEICSSTHMG